MKPQTLAFGLLGMSALLVCLGKGASGIDEAAVGGSIPAALGSWVGRPLPVEKRSLEILETTDVTAMEYRQRTGNPVWLTRVGGLGQRTAFHPPEICYVGSHFEILDRRAMALSLGGKEYRLMRLVLSQGKERFETWYWFTANGRFTSSYLQQQLWLLADRIRGRGMSGTLMRVTTPLEEPAASRRRLTNFLGELDAALNGLSA